MIAADLSQLAKVTYVMAKRHQFGPDFPSRIRRMQELIMARSGIDEFYEIMRLILAKYYAESAGNDVLPDLAECNRLLNLHRGEISDALDGITVLQTPPDVFQEIAQVFGDASISGQDFTALDDAFEQLTSRAYKSDKGQYFTPRHVVDMCVQALDPKPGETVCDPACGSAAFLKSAYSFAIHKHGAAPALYGFDYSHRATQVARVVSLIGTGKAIQVAQVDSLKFPDGNSDPDATIEGHMDEGFPGFDVILTNPPFAGDVSASEFSRDYELAHYFQRKLERDVLFVERCIRLLKIGGRMAMVLPDNKFSARAFRDLRLFIAKNASIDAVVSLHRYTFLPHTSQKACVLFVTRRAADYSPSDSLIRFYRSDRPGKTSNGSAVFRDPALINQRPFVSLDHDLEEIAADIRRHTCAA